MGATGSCAPDGEGVGTASAIQLLDACIFLHSISRATFRKFYISVSHLWQILRDHVVSAASAVAADRRTTVSENEPTRRIAAASL